MNDDQEFVPKQFVRRQFVPELKAINEQERSVLHTITTIGEDRAGDVIEPGGAQLENYWKNPVVLADHDYSDFRKIIGRAEALTIEKDKIVARTKFADTELGNDAFNLVSQKMANAWSIGFKPIKYDARKEKGAFKGFHFKEWELLEYSLVVVPMNPDAITNAVQRGLVHADNIPILLHEIETAPAMTAAEQPKAPVTRSRPELVAAAEEADRLIRRQRMASAIEATLRGLNDV